MVTTYIEDTGSNEEIHSFLPLPQNVKPQDIGSAITYYKRYNLGMLFNLLFDEDDDGNRASGIVENNYTRPISTEPPTTYSRVPEEQKICEKCGCEMVYKQGMSKAGKQYKAWFCTSKDKTHTIFIH